jgi:hypothetical protein
MMSLDTVNTAVMAFLGAAALCYNISVSLLNRWAPKQEDEALNALWGLMERLGMTSPRISSARSFISRLDASGLNVTRKGTGRPPTEDIISEVLTTFGVTLPVLASKDRLRAELSNVRVQITTNPDRVTNIRLFQCKLLGLFAASSGLWITALLLKASLIQGPNPPLEIGTAITGCAVASIGVSAFCTLWTMIVAVTEDNRQAVKDLIFPAT